MLDRGDVVGSGRRLGPGRGRRRAARRGAATRRVQVHVLHRHRRKRGRSAQLRAQKCAISSELAPEIVEEVGCRPTPARARAVSARASASAARSVWPGRRTRRSDAAPRRPVGGGQVLAVGLVAGRHRDDREVLEVGRHHVGRAAARAASRGCRSGSSRVGVGAQAVVADQLDRARRGLVGVDHGLGDRRAPAAAPTRSRSARSGSRGS